MFTEQALKSGLGSDQWLRFFKIMGSVLALREGTPLVSGTPESRSGLIDELRFHIEQLDVINKLNSYSKELKRNFRLKKYTDDSHYYILELVPREFRLRVHDYSKKDITEPMHEYFRIERQHQGALDSDVVLVSADSAKLQTAYQNYFADTSRFIREVKRAVETGLARKFYPGA